MNIASVAGMVGSGLPGNASGNFMHTVFKGAVIRLTECLSIELAAYGVRVNAISPGPIETAAVARFVSRPGLREVFDDDALLRRLGRPEDVAYAALYLASDEAAFVTGVNLPVDGGFTASGGVGRPSTTSRRCSRTPTPPVPCTSERPPNKQQRSPMKPNGEVTGRARSRRESGGPSRTDRFPPTTRSDRSTTSA